MDKWYLISLILYQISNSITPILIMVFPKFIIDEFLGKNDIRHLIFFSYSLHEWDFLYKIIIQLI